MLEKVKRVLNIILLIILIPILIISVVLIIKSYINKNKVPSIFGYSPLIVLSGSMESQIYTGDLIFVKEIDIRELKKDDIIAFFTSDTRQTIITHRIIDINEKNGKLEFTTKGDNNNKIDDNVVKEDLVVGKYIGARIKGLGNVAVFLQTPTGMIIAISIPVFIIILLQYFQNREDIKELEKLRKEKNNSSSNENDEEKK